MKTEIKPITETSLQEAKSILDGGGVVAFPTETVYGLGADAMNDAAVKRIFEIKGRPNDNPLIVHVHAEYDLSTLIDGEPPYAKALREAFLPGPLTMVYPSTNKVSPSVSCGLHTLAVRVPSHAGAQAFLRYVNIPVAAPSANKSKHVSPTTAQHVYADFAGELPLILEGGPSKGGIESTVLDVTGDTPQILREGLITREMIASVAGACGLYTLRPGERAKSPGMMYKHYSPRCRTTLLPPGAVEEAKRLYATTARAYILCEGEVADELEGYRVLNLGYTAYEMAASLYAKLREGEEKADFIIGIEPRRQDGVMAGVMNRLTKACRSG